MTVTSGPGRRFRPQQVVKGLEDKDGSVREFEAFLNRALDDAERLMRSQPSSLPPNHLATALAREIEVLFESTLGYSSTSEEVTHKLYWMCRMAHAAPGVARTLAPRQIQSEYESSIFRWPDFCVSYSSAIASRDLQALQAVQKRARQTLERGFGAKTGDILAELDRIDRQAQDQHRHAPV